MNYIRKETLISSIINALISIAFFAALFRNAPQLILGDTSRLTMDFLPQAFFVGLFAALPASLLTMKRIKAGTVTLDGEGRPPLPQSLPLRIAFLALGSLLLFGGGAVLIFSLLAPIELSFVSALVMKTAYAIFITLIITPLAIRSLLLK
jgi:hypothetical protein